MFKKTLYCLIFLLLPFITKPFVSYCVLGKNGKTIFLAGLEQGNESFKDLARLHAGQFIKFIEFYNQVSKTPITCFYEGTDSETLRENLQSGDDRQLQYDFIIATLMRYKLAHKPSKTPALRLQNYEPRIQTSSDDIIAFFYTTESIIDNLKPEEKLKTKWEKQKKKIRKQKSLATIKNYYNTLDQLWLPQIEKWEKQLWSAKLSKKVQFMRNQKEAFKQATEQAKITLHNFHPNTKLVFALMSLLEQQETKEEVQKQFEELKKIFVENIDYGFAQLGFFTKTLLDQQKQDCTLFLIGNGHIKSMVTMFKQDGYKLKNNQFPTDIGNNFVTIGPDFTQNLFINLYNLFLPDSSKITKSDTRVTRISSKFPMCVTCSRHQTKQFELKACSACKAVFYCSVECQKKDWKQHKTECKKLTGQD